MIKLIPLFTCSLHCGPMFFTAILYLCCQSMYHYIVYCLSYNHLLALSSTAIYTFQFNSLLSRVQLFETPRIAARQSSLSITNSRSSLKLKSIESVMPSSHLILCRPLLLLPPIPPSIRVFSNESTFRIRWPKVLEFILASFLPKNTQD